MTLTDVGTCRHCPAEIVLRPLVTGDYRPFDRALKPAAEVPELGRYVPVERAGRIVMVIASDLAPDRLARIRWYAERHTCAAGLHAFHRAREQRRMAGELAEMWGVPVADVLDRAERIEADLRDPDRYAELHALLIDLHQQVTEGE